MLLKKSLVALQLTLGLLSAGSLPAQKVDTFFFNLYTDSLKKGTYNYINVDGRLSDGHFIPLTSQQLLFSASTGQFEGNSLFVPADCKEEKIRVTACLRSDTTLRKEITIYIKKLENTERLKTLDEIRGTNNPRRRRSLRHSGLI